MGILDRFFKKAKNTPDEGSVITVDFISPDALSIVNLKHKIESLLKAEKYNAKSEYMHYLDDYKKTVNRFSVLKDSGMLGDYCRKNRLNEAAVINTLEKYNNLETLVEKANDEYAQKAMIQEKEYLDTILKEVDPNIQLDEDQRKVVLTDEDYTLVIAGAGAGKTTTVAAKVRYLVDKKNIDPSQILVISYTNKAVQELKERIQKNLRIPCPIATFHSTGNAIIRKQTPEKLNIVEQSTLYFVVLDYFKSSILKNE